MDSGRVIGAAMGSGRSAGALIEFVGTKKLEEEAGNALMEGGLMLVVGFGSSFGKGTGGVSGEVTGGGGGGADAASGGASTVGGIGDGVGDGVGDIAEVEAKDVWDGPFFAILASVGGGYP